VFKHDSSHMVFAIVPSVQNDLDTDLKSERVWIQCREREKAKHKAAHASRLKTEQGIDDENDEYSRPLVPLEVKDARDMFLKNMILPETGRRRLRCPMGCNHIPLTRQLLVGHMDHFAATGVCWPLPLLDTIEEMPAFLLHHHVITLLRRLKVPLPLLDTTAYSMHSFPGNRARKRASQELANEWAFEKSTIKTALYGTIKRGTALCPEDAFFRFVSSKLGFQDLHQTYWANTRPKLLPEILLMPFLLPVAQWPREFREKVDFLKNLDVNMSAGHVINLLSPT
jgi:hypothetical protein